MKGSVDLTESQGELVLIAAAKKGNREAFDRLYIRYRKVIADLVYRYLGNYHETEELLQEVFIQIFLSLDKFKVRPDASFFSWIYRIGINMSINYVKGRKSGPGSISRQPQVLPTARIFEDPEKDALRTEFERDFSLGLSRLSPRQRMIFVLKHFQGMRIAEIAQFFQCSQGTVRKQLFRGVSKLREEMKAYREKMNEM